MIENTIIKRVPAIIGMDRPVLMPELIVPMLISPARGGAKVTAVPAIGRNTLLGVAELYN